MLISPAFKATVLQGLMKIGLFQPDVSKVSKKVEVQTYSQPVVFKGTDGNIFNVQENKGKVIFINLWATWCPPCIAEMPSINRLFNDFQGNENIKFLLVDVENNPGKSNLFMKKRGFNLPVYFPAGDIPREWFSGTLPTTVIIDKSGNIVFHHEGLADYSSNKMAQFVKSISE
jgi:thiol-disulfide isomerase/thioredoxin